MSSHTKLQAKKREADGSGAARRLRGQGVVPGVIYGADQDNYSIQVDAREFGTLLRQTSAENFLVDLQIEGAKEKTKLAMVQDVQKDALSGTIVHVDFHAVNENQTISAMVPVACDGEAAGVKEGGLLDHQLHSIEVHCLPAALPEGFRVDVSELALGDALHVSDLKLPEGVEVTVDGDVVIAIVSEPRVTAADEEAEAAAEAAAAEAAAEGEEPEVIGEGKEAAEGEGEGKGGDAS